MTMSTWIQLPVRMLGMNLGPRKPSSHSTKRTTMIVHNMRFLLSRYLLGAVIVDGVFANPTAPKMRD